MKKQIFRFLLVCSLGFSACELLPTAKDSLSSDDIVKGLRTALEVGTDSSVDNILKKGYYNDKILKIILPPEAKVIEDNISYIGQSDVLKVVGVDLNSCLNNFLKSMNRAADSASRQARPILKKSITDLSINDGLTILQGQNPAKGTTKSTIAFDSTAATNYLIATTRDPLIIAYKQPIDNELNKDLGLGFSANNSWSVLITNYNKLANAAEIALTADAIFPYLTASERDILRKFTVINQITLGEYVTGKALDGLFIKVGEQERNIRRNPWKWITDAVGDILTKVFGQK